MTGPPDSTTVRCLSFHAGYACGHSGACCTANWPIPVEADRLGAVRAALANGRLRSVAPDEPALVYPPDDPPGAPVDVRAILGRRDHACVFFDAGIGRLCRIHSVLGHDALPLACRQFPRVSVTDPRGTSVTLSHFCPTAAGLLDDDAPVAITIARQASPAGVEYVGLDARTSLPPLVRPGLLMDWEAWWEWERLAVRHLAEGPGTPADLLDALAHAIEAIRTWTPEAGELLSRVRDVLADPRPDRRHPRPSADDALAGVLAAIPEGFRPATIERPGRPPDHITRRFLAAHAFGSWTAHLGQGLRTWLRSLEAAEALLDAGLGTRQTDLLLRHLADPYLLARGWSGAESARC